MADLASGKPSFRLGIAGLGLIGGSAGLAARERLGAEVWGWDADPAVEQAALELGAVDHAGQPPADVLLDVVLVATPVPALHDQLMAAVQAHPQAAVTDAGSTKGQLAGAQLGAHYIGGHPLAGAEVSGVENARADLFEGATWYLTPGPASEGVMLDRLHRFVQGLGAKPSVIDAHEHDRLMSAFSHLPHVLANVLTAGGAAALGDARRPVVGPSFRDATRVAGANPELWAGIYSANREALLEDLDEAIAALTTARGLIADADQHALAGWQRSAQSDRAKLLERGVGGGPIEEIRLIVPNRPGVVADLALTLGRAGISIQDMSLSPRPDNLSGEVALWVASDDAAEARSLIGEYEAKTS